MAQRPFGILLLHGHSFGRVLGIHWRQQKELPLAYGHCQKISELQWQLCDISATCQDGNLVTYCL